VDVARRRATCNQKRRAVLSSGEMTEGSGEEPHKFRGEQGARLAVQGKTLDGFLFPQLPASAAVAPQSGRRAFPMNEPHPAETPPPEAPGPRPAPPVAQERRREPVFNIAGAVVLMIGLCALIHFIRAELLTERQDIGVL